MWDDLEDEDVDKVKQAYKEYIEAGNPPIPGEDGDEIDYEYMEQYVKNILIENMSQSEIK